MVEIDALRILEEIQSHVSDHLQVVSYKWLSRKFMVSSNVAKRLLQEFVEKHEEVEVIYSVAGWLKETPALYHIKLVSKPKLAEARQDFVGNCSVQVYSVQSCVPKDLAALWNAEFVQTEELFKQPLTEDNCLRDNRFCGISNSFVKCNTEGKSAPMTALKAKGVGASGQAVGGSSIQTSSVQQPQKKLPQSSPKLGLQSSKLTSAKTETDKSPDCDLYKETIEDKLPLPPSKTKGHSDKTPASGSLTNFWGRASSKSNSCKEIKDAAQTNGVPVSADAQIYAIENSETVSSDDDEPDVNFRRASNGDGGKKRRVVLDDSDDDDFGDAVNLASPDPPKAKSFLESKQKNETLATEKNLFNNEQEDIVPIKKEEEVAKSDFNNPFKNDFAALDQGKNMTKASSREKDRSQRALDVGTSKKNKAMDPAPGSPKRKKVLKTQIDEHGREVTEVVWEGEEEHTKHQNAGKNPAGHTVKIEDKVPTNPVNRAATTKKSPATGHSTTSVTGKAVGKKGANVKDPKQGNILSFFKKKV